ncbi:hypothetical protein GCM10009860_12850 [Microbacterium mitrae]|nr:DUF4352 domain-containing protein [Microbacterium mitrae]
MNRSALTAAVAAVALTITLAGCSAPTTSEADSDPITATQPAEASTAPDDATSAEPAPPAEPEVPGLNTPLTVGEFEFTVTGSAELGATIGEEPLSHTAQGVFLQVDLSVKNIGNKSETFFDSYVTLVDVEGKQYDADSMASIYLDSAATWALGINPGNTMAGPVVFDVPAGTVAEFLMVKDNMFADDGELIALK